MRRYTFRLIAVLSCIAGLSVMHRAAAEAPPKKKPAQTKRIGQTQHQQIVDGNPQKAVELCRRYLEIDPGNLESMYNLALAHGRLGSREEAAAFMQRAIDAGLPPGRFLVGPRDLVAPLAKTPPFRRLADEHRDKLLHGPMLGCVTDQGAKFWVRTLAEVPITVVVSTSAERTAPIRSAEVSTRRAHDFTAVASIDGLQADTRYTYDVLLSGKSTLGPDLPSFRTLPPSGKPARFEVGFGGGAGYTPQHERMWNTIAAHKLPAFLFLGDNVYIDNPTRPDMQHYTYYRRQSRPEYRRFVAGTSIAAIWDDHDFCTNDKWGGPAIDDPPWKIPVWNVFRNNWNNPAYAGDREEEPGCWFRTSIGDVDFFMLDGRYYRTSPKVDAPSMLGPVQKAWLMAELKKSRATFKVLASPVPWVLGAKGNSLDTWRGFETEREEIFGFLEKNRIDGVFLITADRHRSDVWRIDRPDGYPLYEFESSRLTNVHTHPAQPGSLFSYNAKCSFGVLAFDTTKADPEVRYRIYNIDDELMHTQAVRRSEISHQ